MTNKEKITKVAKLFDEIKVLLPVNSIGLTIHGIDRDDLPKGWIAELVVAHDGSKFFRCRRNADHFDITIFLKK